MQAFMGVLLSIRLAAAAIACVRNEAKGRFVVTVVEPPPNPGTLAPGRLWIDALGVDS